MLKEWLNEKLQSLNREQIELEMEDCEFCGGDGIYVDGDNNTSECTICTKGKYDVIKTDRNSNGQLIAYVNIEDK